MEFVERYCVLQPGLKMVDVTDAKYTAKMLCNKVLGDTHDWQIGRTKVFLKVRGVWMASHGVSACRQHPCGHKYANVVSCANNITIGWTAYSIGQ